MRAAGSPGGCRDRERDRLPRRPPVRVARHRALDGGRTPGSAGLGPGEPGGRARGVGTRGRGRAGGHRGRRRTPGSGGPTPGSSGCSATPRPTWWVRSLDALLPRTPLGGTAALLRRERSVAVELPARDRTGALVELAVVTTPSTEAGVWTVSAQHARSDTERALADSAAAHERRFTTLTQRSPMPTLLSEQGLRLAHVNDAFCQLDRPPGRGAAGHRLAGQPAPRRRRRRGRASPPRSSTAASGDIRARLLRGPDDERSTLIRFSHLHTPDLGSGFVATVEDVTERLAFEAQLAHQATHDPLTGLPNRARLTDLRGRALPAGHPGRAGLPVPRPRRLQGGQRLARPRRR